jgi:transcriptional regulator with GAF, ATPase, and Fis domain
MDPSIAAHALARASATLTNGRDVAGTLAALLSGCSAALDVDAAGILVENSSGGLELLSASSHEADELEVQQAQLDEGPCVDAHAAGKAVSVSGRRELLETWPTFGSALLHAGFASVHASPLRWHRSTFGALGLFRRSSESFTAEDDIFAQAFGDIAASLIISTDELTAGQLTARLNSALEARIVVEQAKGVLAEQRGVDMGEAYDLLLRSSHDGSVPLAEWSARIIREAGPQPDQRGLGLS